MKQRFFLYAALLFCTCTQAQTVMVDVHGGWNIASNRMYATGAIGYASYDGAYIGLSHQIFTHAKPIGYTGLQAGYLLQKQSSYGFREQERIALFTAGVHFAPMADHDVQPHYITWSLAARAFYRKLYFEVQWIDKGLQGNIGFSFPLN